MPATDRVNMAPVTRSQAHQQEQRRLPEQMQDPLSRLGPDIMLMHVFGILEPKQLAQGLLGSKDRKALAGLDVLWDMHCEVSLIVVGPATPAEQVCCLCRCCAPVGHLHARSYQHAETVGGQVSGPHLCQTGQHQADGLLPLFGRCQETTNLRGGALQCSVGLSLEALCRHTQAMGSAGSLL